MFSVGPCRPLQTSHISSPTLALGRSNFTWAAPCNAEVRAPERPSALFEMRSSMFSVGPSCPLHTAHIDSAEKVARCGNAGILAGIRAPRARRGPALPPGRRRSRAAMIPQPPFSAQSNLRREVRCSRWAGTKALRRRRLAAAAGRRGRRPGPRRTKGAASLPDPPPLGETNRDTRRADPPAGRFAVVGPRRSGRE